MFNEISNVQLLHTFDVNIYLYPSASNPDSNPDSHLIRYHIEASRLIHDNGLCHERVKELSVFLYTICHIIF